MPCPAFPGYFTFCLIENSFLVIEMIHQVLGKKNLNAATLAVKAFTANGSSYLLEACWLLIHVIVTHFGLLLRGEESEPLALTSHPQALYARTPLI